MVIRFLFLPDFLVPPTLLESSSYFTRRAPRSRFTSSSSLSFLFQALDAGWLFFIIKKYLGSQEAHKHTRDTLKTQVSWVELQCKENGWKTGKAEWLAKAAARFPGIMDAAASPKTCVQSFEKAGFKITQGKEGRGICMDVTAIMRQCSHKSGRADIVLRRDIRSTSGIHNFTCILGIRRHESRERREVCF